MRATLVHRLAAAQALDRTHVIGRHDLVGTRRQRLQLGDQLFCERVRAGHTLERVLCGIGPLRLRIVVERGLELARDRIERGLRLARHAERLGEIAVLDHVLDVAEAALHDIELLLRERGQAGLVDVGDPLAQLLDERADLLARLAAAILRDLVGLLGVGLEDPVRLGGDVLLIFRHVGQLVHHLVELLLLVGELVAAQVRERALERARGAVMLCAALVELDLRLLRLAGADELAHLVHAVLALLRLDRVAVHVLVEHVLGESLAVLLEVRVRAFDGLHLPLDLVEKAWILGLVVLREELGEPLLVRGDLVGDVEQALQALAIEPVGECDRVVLELGDEASIEAREPTGGERDRLAGGFRHQPALGGGQLVEPFTHRGQRLAHRIRGVRILLERGADRAELDHGLLERACELLAGRGLVGRQREPAAEVLHDLLGELLLATQRLLVALARRDDLQPQLARLADVRPTDGVVVLRFDPVANLAAARHQDLGDVPHHLALSARNPGAGCESRPAFELQRFSSLVLAGLPHELRGGQAEIVLDHERELDAPEVRDVQRIGRRHELHVRRLIRLGLDRARRGLDRSRARWSAHFEPIVCGLRDRQRCGELLALHLRGDRRGLAGRLGAVDDELDRRGGDKHARAQLDLGSGQAADIARRRRQQQHRAPRVRGRGQRGLEIADERDRGQ